MRFEAYNNFDKGWSMGLVYVERSVTVCFLKWEWTVGW